jgi:iron complex outermembrane receptor protein
LTTFCAAAPAVAQQTGSIKGVVKDETDASLPGATVTASGPATRTVVSGGDGAYQIANLPPGTYKVTAQMSGFGTGEQKGVAVTAGGTADVPFTLLVVLRGEEVVVTGSKLEEKLIDAPATMSVVSGEALMASPAQNVGDLLRSVPGTNVIQTSARDINIVSREASSTLTNSQLALVDGRSIYLDFFGLILWDFVPTNTADIKQIEVVRGPASVVWGANALTGVVNIITKTPRENPGGSIVLSGGGFSRDVGTTKGEGAGKTFGASLSWAGAPNDTWSYKVAGGYYTSDAYARATGSVPLCPSSRQRPPGAPACIFDNPAAPNVATGGAPYPAFQNSETKQPKADLRVDQELSNGGRINYSGGYAGTRGIIHTGIGPFDIQSGSYMAYGKVGFTKGALKINAFANFVNADAPNLLSLDVNTRKPLFLTFKTQTYDFEAGNSNVISGRHILSYGGNARRNNFDITIAPNGKDRSEFGAYVQDEVFFGKFRIAAGARVDKFGNIDKAVFSPRVALTFKPAPSHALRASFNKAFRAPSLINNYLDVFTFAPQDLSGLITLVGGLAQARIVPPQLIPVAQAAFTSPFPLVIHSVGSEVRRGLTGTGEPLQEESLRAYEIAYTGTFAGKTTVGLAFYINDRTDNINFVTDPLVQLEAGLQPYSSKNPPPGWPAPLAFLVDLLRQPPPGLPIPRIVIPSTATYLNLAPTRNKGFEASIDHAFNREWSAFANYSYQAVPEAKKSARPFPIEEFVVGPKNRFNVGLSWSAKRFIGSASVNYADRAFWTDVLNAPYFGPTDSYTMLNASFGVKWGKDGKIVTSVKGTNLTNDDIQQHVFGDLIKRSIVGELRVGF